MNKRLSEYINRKLMQQQNITIQQDSHQDSPINIQTIEKIATINIEPDYQLNNIDYQSNKNNISDNQQQEIPTNNNLILQSKIEFYGREEATSQMLEEQEERQSLSQERNSLIRKKILEKEHAIITDEINRSNVKQRISRKDDFIDQFEKDYRNQVLMGIENLQEQVQKQKTVFELSKVDELASNQNTQDTNTQQIQKINLNQQQQQKLDIDSNYYQSQDDQNEIVDISTQYDTSKQTNKTDTKQAKQSQIQVQSPISVPSLRNSVISQKSQLKSSILQQNCSNSKKGHTQQKQLSNSNSKNNFSKITKVKEQKARVEFNETVKENLRGSLMDAVQQYENTQDQEKVEDMILEINRLSQKSNGKIPQKQQQKIQELINDIELQKLTYSKKQKNNFFSPTSSLSQTLTNKPNAFQSQSQQKQQQTNVNSKLLKDIIRHTESKVKQVINSSSKANSNRCSLERSQSRYKTINNNDVSFQKTTSYQIFEIENIDQSEDSIREKNVEQLKEELQDVLNSVNSRILSNLLRNRGNQINQVDYEIAYLFALIVSIVDENIPLNNDKSDLLRKSWDDICKYLSNCGRVVYSLQKLRVIFERQDNILKQFNKLQISKKFEERKELFFTQADNSNVILRFVSDLIDLLRTVNKKQKLLQTIKVNKKDMSMTQAGFFSPQQTTKKQIKFNQPYYQFSPETGNSPNKQIQPYYSNQNNSSRPQSISKNSSPYRQDRPITLQQQLIQQKQHAVQKSYQLQLDQSLNFRQREDQAKEKELQIARLKLQQKVLLFQIDKQEKLKQEKLEKEREMEHTKLQAQFNSYQKLSKQDNQSQERQFIRERSLENQEFKRAVRMKDLEESLRQHKEENLKSMREFQYNLQQKQEKVQKHNEECKRKQQEILIEKVRKSEQFLSQKESELDDRLKVQFEQATYRFKQLDETENSIKKELETLRKIIRPSK